MINLRVWNRKWSHRVKKAETPCPKIDHEGDSLLRTRSTEGEMERETSQVRENWRVWSPFNLNNSPSYTPPNEGRFVGYRKCTRTDSGWGTPGPGGGRREVQHTCQSPSSLPIQTSWSLPTKADWRSFSGRKRKWQGQGFLTIIAGLKETQLHCLIFNPFGNQRTFEENFEL